MPRRAGAHDGAEAPTAAAAHRPWPAAGRAAIDELTDEVRRRAEAIHRSVDEEPVHDMRTATRRLRTALSLYRDSTPKKARKASQVELRRVAARLGSVRDLDVLIDSLGETKGADAPLEPLRRRWSAERRRSARRLRTELDRDRFKDALARSARRHGAGDNGPVPRVGHVAPGLIWDAYGRVLAFDLDPRTADPAAVHQMRIAAKKLRYTLEAFENALTSAPSLIETVTTLQDAAGEMHDAIVARDRARSFLETHDVPERERHAVTTFVAVQGRRISAGRRATSRSLRSIRGRAFRESLDRAVLAMNSKAVGR